MHQCAYCNNTLEADAAFCPQCKTAVPGARECTDYRYEAFISYRHLPRDRKVAVRLQRSIEGMRIPKEVRSDANAPKRLGKLFRDEDELPTSASLSDQIKDALMHSRYLVVICSPKTNDSRWVTREVELFASLHGRDRILLALAEGEPQESFPTLLQSCVAKDEQGRLITVPQEPMAADFRSDDRRAFLSERLRVAAALIGCGYDDLKQRERMRKMRVIALAATAIALASIAFGTVSWRQQMLIAQNYRQAQINESETLAKTANDLLANGNRTEAIQVALSALPASATSNDRPFVPAAQLALENALEVYPTNTLWRSSYSFGNVTYTYAVSPNGLQAILQNDGTVQVTNIESGEEMRRLNINEMMGKYDSSKLGVEGLAFCGENLLCSVWGGLGLFDPQTGKELWSRDVKNGAPFFASFGSSVAIAPDNSAIALCIAHKESIEGDSSSAGFYVKILDATNGKETKSFLIPLSNDVDSIHTIRSDFSDDGTKLAVATEGNLYCIDIATGNIAGSDKISHPSIQDVQVSNTNIALICSEEHSIESGATITVDVFDQDLNKRWSKDELAKMSFTPRGTTISARAKIIGTLSSKDNDKSQLGVMSGSSAIVFDLQSGDVTYRFDQESPLCDCMAMQDEKGKSWLIAVDAGGTVARRNPASGTTTVVGSPYDLEIGAANMATLSCCGNRAYIATYDWNESKYRVFRYVDRANSEEMDLIDTDATSWTWYLGDDGERHLYGHSEKALERWDTSNFTQLWSFNLEDVGLEGRLDYSHTRDSVYVYSKSGTKVCKVSSKDGTLLDSFELKVGNSSHQYINELKAFTDDSGKERLAVRINGSTLLVVDAESKDELIRNDEEDISRFSNMEYAHSSMVFYAEKKGEPCYVALSLTSGKPIDADIARCPVPSNDKIVQEMSLDRELFVTNCSDGSLRLYRTSDWSLVWETKETPALIQAAVFSPDSKRLMVQDASGSLLLLSCDTGKILRASSTTLPPISSIHYTKSDEHEAWVVYKHAGLMSDYGLAKTSLEEDSFGPSSDMFMGFYISDDGKTALAYNGSSQATGKYEVYSLNELIDMAKGQVANRPLSDAERYMYHVP